MRSPHRKGFTSQPQGMGTEKEVDWCGTIFFFVRTALTLSLTFTVSFRLCTCLGLSQMLMESRGRQGTSG